MKRHILNTLFLFLVLNVAGAASYPPDGYQLGQKIESPKHSFHLEVYEKEVDGEVQRSVWIVPNRVTVKPQLLVGPERLTELYSVDLSISPDERWIQWEQKLYHGANAVALYEQDSDIHYKEIGPPIFSEQAWRFMSEQTHHPFTLNNRFIIRVSDWPAPASKVRSISLYGDDNMTKLAAPNDKSLLISLYGDDQKTEVDLWFCFYDLEKHRFYLDKTLNKHNKDTIAPSEHR